MAKANKDELVLDFRMLNETANTVRFTELDSNGDPTDNSTSIMGKVYLKKWKLEEWDSPKGLEVIVRPKK